MDRYAGDHYGAMLYDLFDDSSAGQYFRCWGTAVKLTWNCPRSTHRYFINNLLAVGFVSIRAKVISRYVKFFQSLLQSESNEVRLIAQLAAQDKASTTGRNLAKIKEETNLNPWVAPSYLIREQVQAGEAKVPSMDKWRLPYLEKLLKQRHNMELQLINTKEIDEQINIICPN